MLRKTSTLAAALLLALSAFTSSAPAASRDADQRFERMLRSIETVPTRAQLVRAWPDARERLVAAAQQDDRDQYTRSRAISMLSFFPDAGVRAVLEALAGHQDPFVREHAVYTVGRSFGRPGDAKLVELLEAAASDSVRDVASNAVRALRWVDHEAADAALRRVARDHADSRLRKLARDTAERRTRRLRR